MEPTVVVNNQSGSDEPTVVNMDDVPDEHDEAAEPTVIGRRSTPFQPSPEEVGQREVAGHTPFRNW